MLGDRCPDQVRCEGFPLVEDHRVTSARKGRQPLSLGHGGVENLLTVPLPDDEPDISRYSHLLQPGAKALQIASEDARVHGEHVQHRPISFQPVVDFRYDLTRLPLGQALDAALFLPDVSPADKAAHEEDRKGKRQSI